MATNANSTTLAGLLKTLYPQRRIDHIYERGYPFLAEVKKQDNLEGSGVVVPVVHDHAVVSNDFSSAQTNRYPSTNSAFTITGVTQYGVGQVDAITMLKMRSNAGGFVRAVDNEILSVLNAMKKHTALQLYRNNKGYIGVISGTPSTNVITLTNKSDVWNFNIGQTLIISDEDDGGATVRAGTHVVTAMDPDAGTITVTDDGAAADGDYIFNYGNESDTTTNSDAVGSLTGLRDWIPSAAATDTLFGVARTGKPRLYGHRVTDTSLSMEEAIQEAAYRIGSSVGAGSANWRCFMHPLQARLLAYELGSKVERAAGGKTKAGFSGVAIDTAVGEVICVADPACPEDAAWVLDMDCWTMHTLGGLPHLANEDELRMLRVSDADRYEFRYRQFAQLSCSSPISNAYIARNTAI